MESHGELARGRRLHRGEWQSGSFAGGQAFQQTHVGEPMTEQELEQIEREPPHPAGPKVRRLTAEVRRLREYIKTYTAVECRGQTFYPEWAERALRE
jgi:hypothetical protein